MMGGGVLPGLETLRVSVLQSPRVMALVAPSGGDRTITSKSILSLQISLLRGQNVY